MIPQIEKEVLIKLTSFVTELKINNKFGKYRTDFLKIKFNSDDNLPLNETLKFHNITIIIRSVFEENGKYYPHVFLVEYLYEL